MANIEKPKVDEDAWSNRSKQPFGDLQNEARTDEPFRKGSRYMQTSLDQTTILPESEQITEIELFDGFRKYYKDRNFRSRQKSRGVYSNVPTIAFNLNPATKESISDYYNNSFKYSIQIAIYIQLARVCIVYSL